MVVDLRRQMDKEKEFNLIDKKDELYHLFKTTAMDTNSLIKELIELDGEAVRRLKEELDWKNTSSDGKFHWVDIIKKIDKIFGDKNDTQ